LEALTGVLTISVDGVAETSANITLAGATSFTNAATLIQAGFTTPGFAVTWNAVSSAFVFTTTVTGAPATLSFATGTLAAGLQISANSGALLSQGAILDTPATAMANVVANSQNWATMVTLWEPTITDKENFAVFFNSQNDEFLYAGWDSDPNASVQGNTTCFGAVATLAGYNSVTAISGDPALAAAQGTTLGALALNVAIFVAGSIASINFQQTGGRRNLAFTSSTGNVLPTCANLQISKNLTANGYNFYGSYATANQGFIFLYNGQMFGPFKSIVRYINQIWLNSQFQLANLTLLTSVGSVGYDPNDYGLIRNSLLAPITAGINFGAIRTGVVLSALQIAEVNQAAGANVASIIQTQGYYLQIKDPGAAARALGQTPIVNFWYTDGGDILQINMASLDIL
jgi:Protein of unknown function (DUF3383)